jgi:hypothetical protein
MFAALSFQGNSQVTQNGFPWSMITPKVPASEVATRLIEISFPLFSSIALSKLNQLLNNVNAP